MVQEEANPGRQTEWWLVCRTCATLTESHPSEAKRDIAVMKHLDKYPNHDAGKWGWDEWNHMLREGRAEGERWA